MREEERVTERAREREREGKIVGTVNCYRHTSTYLGSQLLYFEMLYFRLDFICFRDFFLSFLYTFCRKSKRMRVKEREREKKSSNMMKRWKRKGERNENAYYVFVQ